MSSFFKMVFELVGAMIYNLVDWIVGFFAGFVKVFFTGWVEYAAIFISYFKDFNIGLKLLSILFALILIAIPVLIIVFIVRKIVLHIRLNANKSDNATLYKEIGRLNNQVLDLIDEKNKILALKVNPIGERMDVPFGEYFDEEGNPVYPAMSSDTPFAATMPSRSVAAPVHGDVANPAMGRDVQTSPSSMTTQKDTISSSTPVGASVPSATSTVTTNVPAASGNISGSIDGIMAGGEITVRKAPEKDNEISIERFPKLSLVDKKYMDYEPPIYNETISLVEFADAYRRFAASQLKLYYTPEIVRRFIAGMAASKILILEGISGTGKTSLPYSFSRFVSNPATIVSVQPSFRDRTEVIGYFNEFSKRFNETEFLRALYEANYREDPNFIVLDEMNLARIEYYFAEMLSILEMPSHDEWILDLVPTQWLKDPVKLENGKIHVTDNMWFIGTANNDDSTYTITDKVYDRAMPIEINERADAFECKPQKAINVRSSHLQVLFDRAKREHPVTHEAVEQLGMLDQYLQTRFKLAFGNRITKQMYDFVPVYVACGGSEVGGMDYIIARKVLKKFESMNVAFVRDEIKGLILFIEKTFGKRNMPDSVGYLTRIQNLY